MPEINLLDMYPKTDRDLDHRFHVSGKEKSLAREFGKKFFDGTRDQGYGGYRYDGRWVPVVKRIIEHYSLPPDARILDVGCGKGFFLHDVKAALPNSSVTGIDIARYAIENAMDDIKPFVIVCDCRALPYADHVFDFVLSITTIHNVHYSDCKKALQEIERVGKKHKFVVVDAYRNEEEKERLYKWNLTAQTMMHVDDWKELFKEAGYTGDYYWFIA